MYDEMINLSMWALVILMSACAAEEKAEKHTLQVTATAYNSLASQTTAIEPSTAAWGDRLEPGMKVIAVSRDLLEQGLDYGTPVQIKGLPGTYRVLDKMNRRWTNRIDIYMGLDEEKARQWGKQEVEISWPVEETVYQTGNTE